MVPANWPREKGVPAFVHGCAAKRTPRLAALIAVVLWALAAMLSHDSISARAEEWHTETADGLRRSIVTPAPKSKAPMVIVLHGATISADLTARWSGFAGAAARHGFAAAYPEGISRLWNDGRGDDLSTSDDVGFLRRLTSELVSRNVADPARIYLAGISNGGMMTLRMLCEAPELYAGAATIIANMPAGAGADCRLRKPMPLVMFNGTADPLVPYEGGGVGLTGMRGNVWAAERTAAFVAHANGCSGPAEQPVSGSRGDPIRVKRLEWSSCSSGQTVTLYRVEGGGHQLYGHTNILPMIFGPGTSQVSAPDIIMDAFAKSRP